MYWIGDKWITDAAFHDWEKLAEKDALRWHWIDWGRVEGVPMDEPDITTVQEAIRYADAYCAHQEALFEAWCSGKMGKYRKLQQQKDVLII